MGNVADGIVDRLRAWGTHRVFGYAGDGVDPLLAALARAEEDIEFVSARHEEMAAFMATGHAKYTGQVGVCLATQGPGAIHLLAGLYDAKLDSKPVVAIVGQVVTTAQGSGYQQEVELPTLFKDVCAQYVQTLAAPEQLAAQSRTIIYGLRLDPRVSDLRWQTQDTRLGPDLTVRSLRWPRSPAARCSPSS